MDGVVDLQMRAWDGALSEEVAGEVDCFGGVESYIVVVAHFQ